MDFKLWRNYSSFLKTTGFWLMVLAYLGEPQLLASVGAIVMLAAWYLRDYIEKFKPFPTIHRLKHRHHRDSVVEEMSILLVEHPGGRHAAFFERSGECLAGEGDTVDQAMHDVIKQMIIRFGGPGCDGFVAAATKDQPTMNEEMCNPDIYENGALVAWADMAPREINALCATATEKTGQMVDWYYVAGRGAIKAVGDTEAVREILRPRSSKRLFVVEAD